MNPTKQNKQIRATYSTNAFRVSYPALYEAKETLTPGVKRYSCVMMFPKEALANQFILNKHAAAPWITTDNLKSFYNEIIKVAKANFGPEAIPSLKMPAFRDGDQPRQDGKIVENEKGYIILRASSVDKPKNLRQDKTVITNPNELYPGCWARAIIVIAPFTKASRGVTLYLSGLQKLADDAPFSSRPRVEDEFDAVAMDGIDAQGAGVVSSDVTPPWMQ